MSGAQPQGVNVRRLARGGVFSLAGSVVGGLAGFLMTAVVTRNTTTGSAGVLFVGISVFLLVFTVVRLGASTGVVYFIARLTALGQTDRLRSVLRTAVRPVAVVSVLTSATLLATAPQVAARLIPSDPTAATVSLRVLAVFLPFAALSDVFIYAARGLRELRPMVYVERLGRPLGQLLLIIVFVGLGAVTAGALSLAWALPYLPAVLVSGWWLRRLLRKAEADNEVSSPVPGVMRREFWLYTWPRWVQSIAQVVLQRLDVILIAALVGAPEAAVYAAVTRFLVFGQLTAVSIGSVVEPHISRLVAQHNPVGVSTVYQLSTAWLILVTWPIYLGMLVFSRQLPMIFGPDYDAGTPVIVTLALTMLVATACGLVDVVLAMAGRTTWTLANALGALVVNVVLNLALIPVFGIMGSAIAWSAAILFKNLVGLAQVKGSLGHWPFGAAASRAAVLAVGCLLVVPGALALLEASFAVLLAAFGLGIGAYAVAVWRSRVPLGVDSLVGGRGLPAGRDV